MFCILLNEKINTEGTKVESDENELVIPTDLGTIGAGNFPVVVYPLTTVFECFTANFVT